MNQSWVLGIALPLALTLIMLGMGMTLTLQDFLRVRHAPKAVLLGLFGQFILPPLMALLASWVFRLDPVFSVGLLILSFAPSGATSNLMTYLSRGDVALSISLTAITSLFIPFTMPLCALLVIEWLLHDSPNIHLPLLRTWAQLVLLSVLPVILGMWLAARYPRLAERLSPRLKPASFIFLLLVIVTICHQNWARLPQYLLAVAPAVLLMNIAALLAGWLWARIWGLDLRQQITIGLEIGVQNGGVALVITLMILNNAQMSVPPVIYGILMLGPSLLFGYLLSRRLPETARVRQPA